MIADLHIHSVYSDGEDTPEQIALLAKKQGVQLVALTDHDNVSGVPQMLAAAKEQGIECLTGIEFSSFSCAEIHILGYNIDINNKEFLSRLDGIKQKRKQRFEKIIKKLNNLGISITADEAYSFAENREAAGRLHIAKALAAKKAVPSAGEAFDKMLGYGKAAYVPEGRILPREAIELINRAGGKAVLAHPYLIDIKPQNLIPLVKQLKEYGLSGIEARYYAHNKFETDFLIGLAKKFDLIATGGSDYHGKLRQSEIFGYEITQEDYIRLKT